MATSESKHVTTTTTHVVMSEDAKGTTTAKELFDPPSPVFATPAAATIDATTTTAATLTASTQLILPVPSSPAKAPVPAFRDTTPASDAITTTQTPAPTTPQSPSAPTTPTNTSSLKLTPTATAHAISPHILSTAATTTTMKSLSLPSSATSITSAVSPRLQSALKNIHKHDHMRAVPAHIKQLDARRLLEQASMNIRLSREGQKDSLTTSPVIRTTIPLLSPTCSSGASTLTAAAQPYSSADLLSPIIARDVSMFATFSSDPHFYPSLPPSMGTANTSYAAHFLSHDSSSTHHPHPHPHQQHQQHPHHPHPQSPHHHAVVSPRQQPQLSPQHHHQQSPHSNNSSSGSLLSQQQHLNNAHLANAAISANSNLPSSASFPYHQAHHTSQTVGYQGMVTHASAYPVHYSPYSMVYANPGTQQQQHVSPHLHASRALAAFPGAHLHSSPSNHPLTNVSTLTQSTSSAASVADDAQHNGTSDGSDMDPLRQFTNLLSE
eukprot:c13079_g8_i1.p1 GENE.c13079_g8_i1~~c13079_g8_i1.p1  ORF type:complete len:568 (-),score=158.11 c13079_g8_i1:346-1827(-)